MPQIHFVNEDKKINVNAGANLRKVARENGIQIYRGKGKLFNCHGFGMCGECVIEVETTDDLSPKKRGEEKKLKQKKMAGDNRRLACQCQVFGRKTIEVTTLK